MAAGERRNESGDVFAPFHRHFSMDCGLCRCGALALRARGVLRLQMTKARATRAFVEIAPAF